MKQHFRHSITERVLNHMKALYYIELFVEDIYFFVWMICFVLYISLSFSLLNVIFSVARQQKENTERIDGLR